MVEFAPRLELFEAIDRVLLTVHDGPRRAAGGGGPAERVAQCVAILVPGRLRRGVEQLLVRRRLAPFARRGATGGDDDLAGVVEGSRAVDTGGGERRSGAEP